MNNASDIRSRLAVIDIPGAEQRLMKAEAERRRLLLATTEDAPILAIDKEIAAARIALDRAVAVRADLEHRLADAIAVEARQALLVQYNRVAKQADEIERQILDEYPGLAAAIIAIAEREAAIDADIAEINERLIELDDAPPFITTPSDRVWAGKYVVPIKFRTTLSLPETDANPPLGAAASLLTREAAYALGGIGRAPH